MANEDILVEHFTKPLQFESGRPVFGLIEGFFA